ncbi:S-DNA-T family DNA segregation ATPase FtsK/SpoIIIE [Virgibacillus halotolerans]|uniref:FtsK/SpoIIIE domain-containing protein n=1 Tax=Virgibacillus halotolerans TaxID=1071053 RepID=UPI0019617978|nr:FtsK/SpoIIIE domain-containing protein [Virgibacillus halotolerans]MBM7600408.1 S-DNA-T family DNA segregation ATPase FtsK/SpoIIIE [Virgibacillus halotolerans]
MFSIIAYSSAILIASSVFLPDRKMTYKKRLSVIFRRNNFLREYRDIYGNLKPQQPKYHGYIDGDNYVEHVYSLPLGKTLSESITNAITSAFSVPVAVKLDGGMLRIKLYNETLTDRVLYDEVPIRAGYLAPVGRTLDGWLFHDFDKTPHMTVAGSTRQGKTIFLKNIMTYLCEHQADDVSFYMIDLKGGLEFGKYESLRQVKAVASDAEDAAEIFTRLKDEMKRTMAEFKRNGYTNIVDTPIRHRTFIVIDEAAQLTPEPFMSKEEKNLMRFCQSAMAEITRVAGALGWRLIHATQYPTGDSLPRAVKQNADAKVAFRLPSELASRVAIDENGAEYLPHPGRGIYRTIDRQEVQVPYISDGEMAERLSKYRVDTERVFGNDGVLSAEVPRKDDDDIITLESDDLRN